MCELCRRRFIRGAAALGAAGLFSSPLMAQPRRGEAASSRLPARGEFTIANAYVMTMDGSLGDIAGGAVHVRNGEIVAVGNDVKAGGQKIDGTGMIVMPGPQTTFSTVSVGVLRITLMPARSGWPSAASTAAGSLTARATTSRTSRWLGSAATASWQSART